MTDREYAERARLAFEGTKVTYAEWRNKAATGAYADITKTSWWQGFNYLSLIGAPEYSAGVFGPEIVSKFPWFPDYVKATPNATSTAPKSGASISSPNVVDYKNAVLGSSVTWDGDYHYFALKNINRVGGTTDGVKLAGGIKHSLVQGLRVADTDGGKTQGFASQRGLSNSALYQAELVNIDNTTLSHGVYWGSMDQCLIASLLVYGQTGYGIQMYPGPSGVLWATQVTACGSVARQAAVAENSTIIFYNSILGPNAIAGVNERAGGVIRAYNCCIPGGNPNDPRFVNCVFEDPGLDAAHRPTNPVVLNHPVDPGFVVPHDYRGRPFTRPILGAVA